MRISLLSNTMRHTTWYVLMKSLSYWRFWVSLQPSLVAQCLGPGLCKPRHNTHRHWPCGNALDMYAAKHRGKYPGMPRLRCGQPLMPNGEVLKDAWGNDFVYFSPAQGCDAKYEIKSLGKDGKDGGAEFDADISSCDAANAE